MQFVCGVNSPFRKGGTGDLVFAMLNEMIMIENYLQPSQKSPQPPFGKGGNRKEVTR